MPKHTDDEIRRRRDRLTLLLAKGATPRDCAEALTTSLKTIYSDLKWLNYENEQKMFEMARQTIPTLYQNCLSGCNELVKQCWIMYTKSNEEERLDANGNVIRQMVDPIDRISQRTRLEAIRLAAEITDKKFQMIQNGPAIFELKKLEQQVNDLRSGIELSE